MLEPDDVSYALWTWMDRVLNGDDEWPLSTFRPSKPKADENLGMLHRTLVSNSKTRAEVSVLIALCLIYWRKNYPLN